MELSHLQKKRKEKEALLELPLKPFEGSAGVLSHHCHLGSPPASPPTSEVRTTSSRNLREERERGGQEGGDVNENPDQQEPSQGVPKTISRGTPHPKIRLKNRHPSRFGVRRKPSLQDPKRPALIKVIESRGECHCGCRTRSISHLP